MTNGQMSMMTTTEGVKIGKNTPRMGAKDLPAKVLDFICKKYIIKKCFRRPGSEATLQTQVRG